MTCVKYNIIMQRQINNEHKNLRHLNMSNLLWLEVNIITWIKTYVVCFRILHSWISYDDWLSHFFHFQVRWVPGKGLLTRLCNHNWNLRPDKSMVDFSRDHNFIRKVVQKRILIKVIYRTTVLALLNLKIELNIIL